MDQEKDEEITSLNLELVQKQSEIDQLKKDLEAKDKEL